MAAVAAMLFAVVSLSSPPPDFRESARLSVRAVKVSGVERAKVYCARSQEAWDTLLTTLNIGQAFGLTDRVERKMYLPRNTCLTMERWVRGKARGIHIFDLAEYIHTFAHEVVHLRGTANEQTAECWADRNVGRIARTYFGVKNRKKLRLLVVSAQATSFCDR